MLVQKGIQLIRAHLPFKRFFSDARALTLEELLQKRKQKAKKIEVVEHHHTIEKKFVLGDGVIAADSIRISSWNINGLRSVIRSKALPNYLESHKPDILCLNEIKITSDQVHTEENLSWIPENYAYYFNCCRFKKSIYGTAIITKFRPLDVKYGFGVEQYDREGRVITAEFENFYLVCCYAPNQQSKDVVKLAYRNTQWDPHLRIYLTNLNKKKRVIVCGDMNVPHDDRDIHGHEVLWRHYGHFHQERINLMRLMEAGFVDPFREMYPHTRKYTSWGNNADRGSPYKGARLDYFLISKEIMPSVQDSLIQQNVYGSDHCPVELIFNPNFEKKEALALDN